MAHGDDNGLVLPPQVAPIQIIIVPIPGQAEAAKFAQSIYHQIKSEFRAEIDLSDDESAGFKYNKWELKGVPLRLEIGQKEVNSQELTICRRDNGQKTTFKLAEINSQLKKILDEIQTYLFSKHQKFTQDHTFTADTYDEFKNIMDTSKGFILAHWCQNPECEAKIKKETTATTRCLPLDSKEEIGKCIYCGNQSHHRWLFAQSY
jgi:prolyl-tRNA synthetase